MKKYLKKLSHYDNMLNENCIYLKKIHEMTAKLEKNRIEKGMDCCR